MIYWSDNSTSATHYNSVILMLVSPHSKAQVWMYHECIVVRLLKNAGVLQGANEEENTKKTCWGLSLVPEPELVWISALTSEIYKRAFWREPNCSCQVPQYLHGRSNMF